MNSGVDSVAPRNAAELGIDQGVCRDHPDRTRSLVCPSFFDPAVIWNSFQGASDSFGQFPTVSDSFAESNRSRGAMKNSQNTAIRSTQRLSGHVLETTMSIAVLESSNIIIFPVSHGV